MMRAPAMTAATCIADQMTECGNGTRSIERGAYRSPASSGKTTTEDVVEARVLCGRSFASNAIKELP